MLSAYLTIKDVSNWLQVKPSTLYAWAAQGKIPSVKMNGLVRFEQEALRRWLERPQEDQAPQLGAFPFHGRNGRPRQADCQGQGGSLYSTPRGNQTRIEPHLKGG